MKRLVLFELRKLFTRRLTQAALAALLALSLLFGVSSYLNMYAFDGISRDGSGKEAVEIERTLARKYGGILTDEKVRQMMADFAPGYDLKGLNALYLYRNATQSAVFARFSDQNGNWNGKTVADVFGDEEIKTGYIHGWLITSDNMVKINIVLLLAVTVLLAPVFCGEYGGMDSVLLCTRYGRTKCVTAKILASLAAVLILVLSTAGLNFLLALGFYGNEGLTCSILFAPIEYVERGIPFNITVGTMVAYQALLSLTGAVGAAGITLLFSAGCGHSMAALAVSAGLLMAPALVPVSEMSPIFRYISLLPIYHAQFVSLMSIEQMKSGLLYAVWAVPAAALFLAIGAAAARKIFAKHQVT